MSTRTSGDVGKIIKDYIRKRKTKITAPYGEWLELIILKQSRCNNDIVVIGFHWCSCHSYQNSLTGKSLQFFAIVNIGRNIPFCFGDISWQESTCVSSTNLVRRTTKHLFSIVNTVSRKCWYWQLHFISGTFLVNRNRNLIGVIKHLLPAPLSILYQTRKWGG